MNQAAGAPAPAPGEPSLPGPLTTLAVFAAQRRRWVARSRRAARPATAARRRYDSGVRPHPPWPRSQTNRSSLWTAAARAVPLRADVAEAAAAVPKDQLASPGRAILARAISKVRRSNTSSLAVSGLSFWVISEPPSFR